MKYAGIDYGTKRVGIAVSDPEGRLAFPKKILGNTQKLLDSIATFLEEEKAEALVFGESLAADGRENEVMAKVRQLADALSEKTGLPVYFEKEFFTSVEARRSQEDKKEVDDSAAALILQRFLDKKNQQS